jgi:hypothetical protein
MKKPAPKKRAAPKAKAKTKVKAKAKAAPRKRNESVTRDASDVTRDVTPKAGSPGAPKGNQFWRLRSKHGANSKYTAAQLWEACTEYFEHCEAHPLLVTKTVFTKNGPETAVDERPRAFTQQGLCVYLGISSTTWHEWRKSEDKAEIVACVDNIMFEQKFTGAAVDVFNANIIARNLGLAEKVDNTNMVETHEERMRRLMAEGNSE